MLAVTAKVSDGPIWGMSDFLVSSLLSSIDDQERDLRESAAAPLAVTSQSAHCQLTVEGLQHLHGETIWLDSGPSWLPQNAIGMAGSSLQGLQFD